MTAHRLMLLLGSIVLLSVTYCLVRPEPVTKANSTTDMNHASQIWIALLSFAEDHDGRFPDDLDSLVSIGLFNQATFQALVPSGKWSYYGKGRRTDELDFELLVRAGSGSELLVVYSSTGPRWKVSGHIGVK